MLNSFTTVIFNLIAFDSLFCFGCIEHPNSFVTFDRAYREKDGGYKVTGRADDVIATGEQHYDPWELETVLVWLGVHVHVYQEVR